ncbi:MAG: hypothetical protein HKN72_10810 [Gemmatimonadetes bacterium]|nr:hypothetical protein [Gemmatimonadota bacterium]
MIVHRPLLWVGVALTLLFAGGEEARAQFTEPCQAACALTLGASSFVFAMGTMATVGRMEGGYTTKTGPAITFAVAFFAASGAGLALNGNGDRQRRTIYGSALGAAGGALVGLAAESLIGEHDAASRWAATLVGGAIGVIAGGLLGTTLDGVTARRPELTVVIPPIAFPTGR